MSLNRRNGEAHSAATQRLALAPAMPWDGHDTPEKYMRIAAMYACENKDPNGCWNVRCNLGGKCCRAPQAPEAAASAPTPPEPSCAWKRHQAKDGPWRTGCGQMARIDGTQYLRWCCYCGKRIAAPSSQDGADK